MGAEESMKRIFIALKVEAEKTLLHVISSLKSGLTNERIKWTNPENIHITLAFLGDTEERNIGIVSDMLAVNCNVIEMFNLTLKGAGVFRNYSDPRVLWIGIDASKELEQLNSLIMTGLRASGMLSEERPFNPHVTLGRIKEIRNKMVLRSEVEQYKDTIFQKVRVKEVILYESILLPNGPVYKPIGKYPLNPPVVNSTPASGLNNL
jgi:RNA 2',3'-cyclic 3'-phosphodiesterase